MCQKKKEKTLECFHFEIVNSQKLLKQKLARNLLEI